jgi:hypothetical protein
MSQHYSAHEQWLINQDLSSLDMHLTVTGEELRKYLLQVTTPGECEVEDDFNIIFSNDDPLNRFSLEISLVYIKTSDESFQQEFQNFIDRRNKLHRRPYFSIPPTNSGWLSLVNEGLYRHEINQYQKFLLNQIDRLLKEKTLEKIIFQLLIRGPILYRVEELKTNPDDYDYYDNNNEDEFFDESMTALLVHPFVKLPRMHVSTEEKPIVAEIFTFPANVTQQEVYTTIHKKMEKITVVQGDKILFAIDNEIIPLFKRWITDRQTSDTITKQINLLYPTLTSLHFLTQLHEWTELGKQIIKETELLNNQIHALTQSSTFDMQTVEIILKKAWANEGKSALTREELLDRWVKFLQDRGETRSSDYIKKSILRHRLNVVIENVNQTTEFDKVTFEVFKESPEKSGKPSTLFKLVKME